MSYFLVYLEELGWKAQTSEIFYKHLENLKDRCNKWENKGGTYGA